MNRVLEIAVGVVLLILLATMVLVVLFAALSGKMCAMMIWTTTRDDADGILIANIRNSK